MERYFEKSILETCSTDAQMLEKIYDRMLSERKPEKLKYVPSTKLSYIGHEYCPGANLAVLYPDYEEGDYAYLTCFMDGLYKRKMMITVRNYSEVELWFNGVPCPLVSLSENALAADVEFCEGQNCLVLKVIARNGKFSAFAAPTIPELRMYPCNYVYATRQYIEAEGFRKQPGVQVSRLYRSNEKEPETIDWVLPQMPKQSNEKVFDFEALCKNGNAAYVHTHFAGTLNIVHESPLELFANGESVYYADKGCLEISWEDRTSLLFKSCRTKNAWGFQVISNGTHELPFVEGADCPDLQWLWVGPFGLQGDTPQTVYAPERNLQFDAPYATSSGQVYWCFYRKDTNLRQYLISAFWGESFYALHVGVYGMKQAAKVLGKRDFDDYFTGWMETVCRHKEYGAFDTKRYGWGSYLTVGCDMKDLDSIGTLGINISEYYLMTGDIKAKFLLQQLKEAIRNVPRFEDGVFRRATTMWTDDMYMSIPFLVRLGLIFNEGSFFDDAVSQIKGFYERMFMEEHDLYSHILFINTGKCNKVPWGRGNGWVLLALSELLMLMPKSHPGYDDILNIYRRFAGGVKRHRNPESGVWHQVINNPNSYPETSGTAMFIIALARGVRLGWLDASYKECVIGAWNKLLEHFVDAEGNVYGICKGSGCSMEEEYYLRLSTIFNDDHGMGIVLEAGTEIISLKQSM